MSTTGQFLASAEAICARIPSLLQQEFCPVFITTTAFDVNGLGACVGLGIHPVAPGLRPLPALVHNACLMQNEMDRGLVLGHAIRERFDDFCARINSLAVALSPTWFSQRFGNISESRISVAAKPELQAAALGAELQQFANLLNNEILTKRGLDPAAVDSAVKEKLLAEGVEKNSALALSAGTFPAYLKSFRKDGALEPLNIPRDTKILDYSRQLLFNDTVNYFRAAGFGGGYLFIDDIENLVDQMSRSEHIGFAKEFGLCTVRPGYANTAYNLFSCVLTTHQQASVSLSQAWGEAGLSAIARLDPASPNSIELPLTSRDQAREIIVAHLDHYRINSAAKGSIKPFTEEGIEELLKNRQLLHPRVLLTTASKVIAHAVDDKHSQIDAAVVSKALESTAIQTATPDVTEGIEGAT